MPIGSFDSNAYSSSRNADYNRSPSPDIGKPAAAETKSPLTPTTLRRLFTRRNSGSSQDARMTVLAGKIGADKLHGSASDLRRGALTHSGPTPSLRNFALNHSTPSLELAGLAAFAEMEKTASSEIKQETRGEVFNDKFTYNGQELLSEKASRTDVMSTLSKGNNDRIEDLKAAIQTTANTEPVDTEKLAKLEKKLEHCTQLQTRVEGSTTQGKTWASSASYRKLLGSTGSLKSANEQYIPACVNLRTQVVTKPDGSIASSINRSGAISDYRNGSTNLDDMKSAREVLKNVYSWDQVPASAQQTVNKTLNQAAISDHMAANKGAINKDLAESFLENLKKENTPQQALKKLESAIVDREFVLENQALQDLVAHFDAIQTNGGSIDDQVNKNSSILFGRVSMLDGIKQPVLGQFELNEKNQMLDMKAIYQTLNGKDMVFDGKGPFIDNDGAIHMPFRVEGENGPVSKPLNAIFFNISAQGNVQNEGPQKEINEDALKQVNVLVNEACKNLVISGHSDDAVQLMTDFMSLKNDLEQGVTSGFLTAEKAMDLMLDCNSLVSINCFSGKDRTGLLAAKRTLTELNHVMDGMELSETQKQALTARFGRQLLDNSSVACLVVADNTGHRALKISTFDLDMLMGNKATADWLRGCSQRIEMYGRAGATFLLEPSADDLGTGQLHF